jgi:ABC-type bacteriocin/lantibiotic exporter with double-glycine peptidase domain
MKLHFKLFSDVIGFLCGSFPAMLMLMVIVGLTEGLSVTLLLPLLSHIGISYTTGQGFAGAVLSRGLTTINASVGTLGVLVILIATAVVQTVLYILLQWWMVRASRGYQRQRQLRLFNALMRAQWEFVISRKAGELTSAIVSESERLAQAFHVSLYLISTSIISCIYLVFALMIAWPITLALLCCALLMTFAVLRLYRQSSAVGKSITPLNAELQSILGEQISGIKIVKATTSEHLATVQVDRIIGRLERANTLATILPVVVRGLFEFLAFILLAAIFVFGERGFGIAPGNVIVVFALFVRLFPRITTLQGYLHMLNTCLHALDAIGALQAAAEIHAERTNDKLERLSVPLPARLELHNVDVKFGELKVLDQIDLVVPIPGMVGIIGGSGAGKSTLVHSLLSLVPASAGTITFGTHSLASAPLYAWRQQIGYAPQETILFHASVRENLNLANPKASSAEVELAAKRAHAHDFIKALPRGYETRIGDQGVKLSGGQRQRLSIARALLNSPKLLVMDEAMSALDAESEADVLRTLEDLRKQIGILIVAHRLSAVRTADSIYVIEAGRVVECGTWNELMARRKRLYALAEAQSLTEDRALATI